MHATINGLSIPDTEDHVADICTWERGSKGIVSFMKIKKLKE